METINIQNIYKVQPTIDMASELFYICELGKNFAQAGFKDIKYQLSIKDLKFDETLKKSIFWPYFCKAIKEGWLVDADENIKLNAASMFDSRKVQDISIVPKTIHATKPNEVPIVYDIAESGDYFFQDTENVATITKGIEKQTWVTLLAYFTVRRYLTAKNNNGASFNINIIISKETMNKYGALSYLMLLYENKELSQGINIVVVNLTMTSKDLCNPVVEESYKPIEETNVGQVNYEAWLQDGRDKGLVEEKYKYHETDIDFIQNEKVKALRDANVDIDDVVALYRRDKEILTSVDLAVVRDITKEGITLEIVHNKKSLLDVKSELYAVRDKDDLMLSESILGKRTSMVTLNWQDLGVNKDLYKEKQFIVSLDNIEDEVTCHVAENGFVTKKTVSLQYYWARILYDYKVDFNIEKYAELYIKKD